MTSPGDSYDAVDHQPSIICRNHSRENEISIPVFKSLINRVAWSEASELLDDHDATDQRDGWWGMKVLQTEAESLECGITSVRKDCRVCSMEEFIFTIDVAFAFVFGLRILGEDIWGEKILKIFSLRHDRERVQWVEEAIEQTMENIRVAQVVELVV